MRRDGTAVPRRSHTRQELRAREPRSSECSSHRTGSATLRPPAQRLTLQLQRRAYPDSPALLPHAEFPNRGPIARGAALLKLSLNTVRQGSLTRRRDPSTSGMPPPAVDLPLSDLRHHRSQPAHHSKSDAWRRTTVMLARSFLNRAQT